jgi:hypothetical protein
LSDTEGLFRIQASYIVITQKAGSVWPLVNANLVNPLLKGTDYFMQITIPNTLKPVEIGDSNKSPVFTLFDLREIYNSFAPQTVTFQDFVPIIYRFYDPPPQAYFDSFEKNYTTMQVQFTNSLDQDHPLLTYADIQLQCHVEGLDYALRR